MEDLETCLGHIIGRCPDCSADEKNKKCPGYKPVALHTFEVVEPYSKQTQQQ